MCLWARHNQNTKEGLSGVEGSEAVAKNRAFFFSLLVVDEMKSNMSQLQQMRRFSLDRMGVIIVMLR